MDRKSKIKKAKVPALIADNKRMVIEVASLLIGTLCLFLGYKLLMRGVYLDGDAKAVWSDRALLIKRGAPGVIFALFGATMIVVPLLHSGELRSRAASSASEQTRTEQDQTDKQSPSQRAARKRAREEGSRPHVSPQQAAQPADRKSTQEKESSGEEMNQPKPPTKTWKPGRA